MLSIVPLIARSLSGRRRAVGGCARRSKSLGWRPRSLYNRHAPDALPRHGHPQHPFAHRLPPHAVEERRRPDDGDRHASRRARISRRSRGASASPTSSSDGPFSAFAGVDRTLVLLAGAGMRLTGDGEPLELRMPFEPVDFSGDAALHCSLVGGPGARFQPDGPARQRSRRQSSSGAKAGEPIAPADTYVCYAAAGASECLLAGHPPISLVPRRRRWW